MVVIRQAYKYCKSLVVDDRNAMLILSVEALVDDGTTHHLTENGSLCLFLFIFASTAIIQVTTVCLFVSCKSWFLSSIYVFDLLRDWCKEFCGLSLLFFWCTAGCISHTLVNINYVKGESLAFITGFNMDYFK